MAKRRANGEGNIRKRKDGRWEGRYTAGTDPETGKQIFKNVLGKTQAEVKEKLKKALEEARKIDVTRTGKYTVEQWMEEWFENVCKIKVRPSSHQTYRGYIDHHVAPNIGKIPLEKLSTMDLQKLYRKLMNKGRVERIESKEQPKGLSAKTVRNINQVNFICIIGCILFFQPRMFRMSDVKQSTLDNIVRGLTKNPRIKTLHTIALAFNMTFAEFLDFDELNDYCFDDDSEDE